MVEVRVEPEAFTLVEYDADRIAELTGRIAEQAGLDGEVVVRVDETHPLGRVELVATDPVTIEVESGAFEDPKRPRQLSEDSVSDAVGRVLFEHADRLDPAFGAPADDDIELPHRVAWAVYCAARLGRLGYRSQRQRRLYHFRNRCGFTDAADAAFDRLWTEDDLTWPEIVALVDGALAQRETAA